MIHRYLLTIIVLVMCLKLTAQPRQQRAEALYEEALGAYRSRDLKEAQDLIQRSMHVRPTAKASYLSGMIHEASSRDLRAVSAYEATLKLDPEYYEAIFQKGLIYLRYGDAGQAYADFDQLIDLGGTLTTRGLYFETDLMGQQQQQVLSMANMESRLYHYRGQASEKLSAFGEALEDYNIALSLDTVPDYLISRGLLYEQLGQTEQAIRDLKVAVSLDTDNQLAWYNLVVLDPSESPPARLLETDGFSPTLSLLASRAMDDENYILAKRYFDKSIANDNGNALTYLNRGRALLKMQQYTAARKDFMQGMKLNNGRFEALYLIGNTYFFEENFEQALAYYNQYLTIDPTNGMVWYNGAMSYLELENNEEGCHYLQKAHALGMLQARQIITRYCD